jgi:PAS domain S-box-containing protein
MKRLLAILCLVGTTLLLLPPAPAVAAKPDKITVAYCIDCVQFHFQNEQGHADGLITDMWRLWSKKTGIQIDFKAASWEETLRMVGAGEADAHAGLFYNDERNKFLKYGSSLTETDTHFFTHKSLLGVNSVADLADFKVGVLAGDYVEGYLKERLPPENIIGFESYEAIIAALKKGELRVFAADTPTGLFHLQKNGMGFDFQFPADKPLYRNAWYTAVTKGNPALVDVINEGMALISPAEKRAIENRWSLIIVQKARQGNAEGVRERLNLTEKERQWLLEHPVIRVHNEKDWPPFNFFESGRPQGFSIDYMKVLAETIGFKVEFITGPTWSEFLGMMKSGDLDVMLNIVRTPDREKYMHYTKSFTSNPNAILSRKGKPYEQLEQLNGKIVAVTKGFFQEEILRRDFPEIKLYLGTNATETMKAVAFGKADAALGELSVLNHLMSREMMTGLVVSGELKLGDPEYSRLNIAVRNDWPILASILQKGMDVLDVEELDQLRRKWSGGSESKSRQILQLTGDEWAWLKQHKTIRLGIDALYPPFEFVNENGQFSGMASDYVKLISERLGITMKVVNDMAWMDVLDGIENRTIDVLPSISGSPELEPFINFTRPHIAFPLVVVTKDNHPFVNGLEDFTSQKVALMNGYGVTARIRNDYPTILRSMHESPLQALQAVSVGNAQATVLNLAVATYLIKKHNINNLKIAAPANIELPGLSFGVREDWPELVGILDKALASITSDEESAIRSKWAGVRYEQGTNMQLVFQIGSVAVIILLVIVIWNRQLRNEVTQRKKVETALRESEEQMSSAFETSTAGMFMHDDVGKFFKVNRTFCKLLGYSEQELLGMNWREVTHPDDMEATEAEDSLMVHGSIDNFALEKRYLHKDGHIFWGRLFTSCNRDEDGSPKYIFCQVYDISDRKRAEQLTAEAKEHAAAAEALLNDAIENISDGFVLYDAEDRLVKCNSKFMQLYDYSDHDCMPGMTWTDLEELDTSRGTIAEESKTDVPQGERRWDDFERFLADGRWIDIRQRKTTSGGVVSIQVDITDRKQAEQLMKEAKEQAERIADQKSEFIAVVSHEVRTPMNGVLGMARLLMETKLDDEQEEFVSTILASGESLITIINDLLDISKLDADKLEVESRPFAAGEIVQQSMALMQSKAREMGLDFNKSIDPEIPAVVLGDPHRLRQILLNLLSNAIKFTDKGSVSLEAKVMEQTGESAILSFTVSDTGKGIPAETIEKLFHAYSQGSVEVARKYGGTGLGLSICRRLAHLMDGEITVQSTPSEGSQFMFKARFILAGEEAVTLLEQDEKSHDPTPAPGLTSRPLKVLQVEDNAINRSVVERGLTRVGHNVSNAENGKLALQVLERESFDVILMDRHMPVMDGLEATRRIRQMAQPVSSIPIIGITAGASEADIKICLESGMDQCLTKPVDANVLRARLESLGADQTALVGMPVLVVDDVEINRAVARAQLNKLSYPFELAESGEQALMKMEQGRYSLVLLDVNMPGMNGIECVREIRTREEGKGQRIPVIAVTGHVDPKDRDQYVKAGMDDVLTKPLDIDSLNSVLLRWTTQSKGGASQTDSTQSVEADQQAPASPIDLERLARTLGEDDEDELFFMLGIFNDEYPKLLENLEEALQGRDARHVHDCAHAAKGAAANAAAPVLMEIMKSIEVDAHLEEWDDLEKRTGAAKIEYSKIVQFCNERG